MKHILLFVVLFLFTSGLKAQQCQLPNGSFEVWEDLTILFDSTGVLEPETIIVPDGYIPVFRLFLLAFDQLFGGITDQEFAEGIIGVSRSDMASDGESAALLGGNSLLPLADLFNVFECRDIPDRLVMDIAHIGDRLDSLRVVLEIGNISDNDPTPIAIVDSLIISQEPFDYQEFSFDVTDSMNGISPDTSTLLMLVSSDTMTVSDPTQYGFLLDNLRLEYSTISTTTPNLGEAVKVYPMPFSNSFSLDNDNGDLEAVIYDTNGRLIKTVEVSSGTSQHNMNELTLSGNYILKLRAKGLNQESVYNIIRQ